MSDERRRRILNVDDNDAGRYAVSEILPRAGFEVVEAATGREALELVADQPDLVLLDVNLPDINGFEVCARIKSDPATAAIPVVHLTAEAVGSDSRAEGLEGGADGYLTKPIDVRELVATVQATLRLCDVERGLRESDRRYRSLFENMAEGVAVHELVVDDEGVPVDHRILDVNPAYTLHTGIGADQACGKLSGEVYGTAEPSYFTEYTRTMRSGEPSRFQAHLDPLGKSFDITVVRQSETRSATVLRDVAERVRAEQALARLNDKLEERVAARTAEIERANRELASLAYSMAHNLRTPLRGIDGFSHLLLDSAGATLDDQAREHLTRIRRAIRTMDALIDGLLELSRLGLTELLRERVDLSESARGIAHKLEEAEPHRHVEFVIADGLAAGADRSLTTSVLTNLMGNAWKFTAEHATARIEVGVVDADGERAFFVRDDGAGFDMAHSSKLFSAFESAHAAERFGRPGIGLAVVQHIVELHGGHVWAQGEIEKGATFFFTLPAGAAAPEPAPD